MSRFHVAPFPTDTANGASSPWFTPLALKLTGRILQQEWIEREKRTLTTGGGESCLLQSQIGAIDDAGLPPMLPCLLF